MAPDQAIAIRAVGTALAGLSFAFAVQMLAYGGVNTRVNGMEYHAVFAQPRGQAGEASPVKAPAPPTVAVARVIDMATTGSLRPAAGKPTPRSRLVEIVAARADRVWLRIDGAILAAAPGDSVAGVGRSRRSSRAMAAGSCSTTRARRFSPSPTARTALGGKPRLPRCDSRHKPLRVDYGSTRSTRKAIAGFLDIVSACGPRCLRRQTHGDTRFMLRRRPRASFGVSVATLSAEMP